MKEVYCLMAVVLLIIFNSSCKKDKAEKIQLTDTLHHVQLVNSAFDPDSISINIGDTVSWTNNSGGYHNVNGTLTDFSSNPEGFGNPVDQNWTFEHIFNTTGSYDYRCDAHYGMGMIGKVIVN